MMSSRNRNRTRRRLHVVKEQNPVEEEKAPPGINVKQMVTIGAITAATGTVVGAVVMELYRYMRPKIPIPQAIPTTQQNPALPWAPQMPQAPAFQPNMGIPAPPQYAGQTQASLPPFQPGYAREALPPAQYANPNQYAPQAALPPAPHEIVPTIAPEREPLSRTQLAQWQRGLESWERRLERRDES